MFSANFNEEDKKRNKNSGDNQHRINDDLFSPLESPSSANDTTTYAVGENKPYDINHSIERGFPVMLKLDGTPYEPQVEKQEEKPETLYAMPARDVLNAQYNKPGSWGDYYRRINPEITSKNSTIVYSLSQKALDDIANDYFTEELDSIYKANEEKAQKELHAIYDKYSNNPREALRLGQELNDPFKIIDSTMNEVDTAKLRNMVAPLARYGGFDVDEYIEKLVKPTLRDMMIRRFIDRNKPKNSYEYILRSLLNRSIIGKTAKIALRNNPYIKHEDEMLASYDASRLEDFVAGVGSLVIDAPVFKSLSFLSGNIVGKATSIATNRLASRVYSYNVADGMSRMQANRIATRAITNSLSTKIAQSATMQGLTLGTYDLAHSVADDVLNNEFIDGGKAASSFGKGFLTGAGVGVVGTRMRHAGRGLTGGKKLLASTGVLGAESAVFTLSTEADKALHGVEIEPIDLFHDYAESVATLGVMKMTHWRPKGAKNKLKEDGTLKDELKLSNSEQEELRELNIDPVDFMNKIEKGLNLPSYGLGETSTEIAEKYIRMMQSEELSASARAKLMYLVENRLTSTPPVPFDFKVEKNRKGRWLLTSYDFEGNKIEQHVFNHSGMVQDRLIVEKNRYRKNRIAAYERELLLGFDSQNLLRQAGIYAKEKDISVNDISHALYKRATNSQLSEWESHIVREIVDRTAYDATGMVQFLADMRREIERKYSLDEGALLVKIDEPFFKCEKKENLALEEYEALVRNEVELLKGGTDRQRAAEFERMGRDSSYKGMTNDEVKAHEVEDYYIRHPEKIDAVGNGVKNKPIEIDDDGTSEYVWSYNGVDNTVEDIARYESEALKIAKRFNLDLEFIRDAHDIRYPDIDNPYDVNNYNNKLRSLGWTEKDKGITINLPNISSYEELEKTIVHEGVAHYGLSKLFGNHLDYFLEELYRKSSSEVRAGVDAMEAQYRFADNYTIIEEYIAKLTEKAALTTNERRLVNYFKDFVRNSLIRLNIYTGRNRRITNEDVESLIRQHAKYMHKRISPSRYRRWVFGLFDAAKQNESSYHDRGAYEKNVRARMDEGTFMKNTPSPLYNTKAFKHYEIMPEEMKSEFQKRWNSTDEEIMRVKSDNKYRFIGKKGAGNRAYYESGNDMDPELARAIEMEKKGYSSEEIRFTTGWERGIDNEWRTESSDRRLIVRDHLYKALAGNDEKLAREYIALKEIPMDAWGADEIALWERIKKTGDSYFKSMHLRDILHDPSFYAEYPELATLPVEMVDNPNIPFRYDSKNKKIVLDKSFFLYPENHLYMSGLLQNVIQDYEGFSKAVSLNMLGINSRLRQKYNEARNLIDALNNARNSIPGFDKDKNIDKVFAEEFKFTPEEFAKRFPSLDEYLIYRLTGKEFSFSGDVEVRNVINRFDAGDYIGRVISPETTEDVPRSKQVPIKRLSDLKKYFNGPLDIIYQKLEQMHSDDPLILEEMKERVRRADLSPLERGRFEWEMEEYAKSVLKKLMDLNDAMGGDQGYSDYKKKHDQEIKRRSDYFKFQDWKNRFKDFNQDPEDLN